LRDGSNKLDESLGVVIAWSSFSTNADDSCDELVLSLVYWSIEDIKISENDVKDIHKLSLVLMDSLTLDIVHNVFSYWHIIASSLLNPSSKLSFVLLLDLDKLILELSVRSIWHQLSQVVKSSDPLVNTTKGITDEIREFWVAAMNPSSWSNTVGLVLEFTWVKLIELTEDSLLKKFRMESSDTVNGMGAHNSEESHSDFLWPSLLNQGHSLDLVSVTWILLHQLGNVNMVDQINKFKMSW